MITVVGVRFRRAGKIYYFCPKELNVAVDDHVIVETSRGIEFGTVVLGKRKIDETSLPSPVKDIIRKATWGDEKQNKKNKNSEASAMEICQKKIKEHQLPMKLIDVNYTFDQGKIIFYFSAESRVDFRELVKDLAAVFRTRIELRQIGVRDEAKMLGGYSTCGRELCCHAVLGEFQPVSIKMAKQQNLSLNPSKISGVCGRLMCCLKYEYEEDNGKSKQEGKAPCDKNCSSCADRCFQPLPEEPVSEEELAELAKLEEE